MPEKNNVGSPLCCVSWVWSAPVLFGWSCLWGGSRRGIVSEDGGRRGNEIVADGTRAGAGAARRGGRQDGAVAEGWKLLFFSFFFVLLSVVIKEGALPEKQTSVTVF